jgi:hypothetical protein
MSGGFEPEDASMANPSIPWSRGNAPLAERPVWTSTLLTIIARMPGIAYLRRAGQH